MPKPHVKKGRGKPGQNLPPIPDMRASERALSAIHAALAGQQFESIEEANAFLQAQLASGGFAPVNKKGATPLEKAQDIMYDAWDAQGKQRIDLAYKALSVSKDCADAYVLLSEEAATNIPEAIRFLEDGVNAGIVENGIRLRVPGQPPGCGGFAAGRLRVVCRHQFNPGRRGEPRAQAEPFPGDPQAGDPAEAQHRIPYGFHRV